MSTRQKKPLNDAQREEMMQALRDEHRLRQSGYREQALKMFPHVCARCTRELEGKKIRELTVHHKDHNHDNNPPDGSNWELLCVYCHDHEHTRGVQDDRLTDEAGATAGPSLSHSPFAALAQLQKKGSGQ
ncbi:MAG: YajD family HNH nuclease [Pelovirga sp.]